MNPELIPNVDVPEGERGSWKITRFNVSKTDAEFSMLRASLNPHRCFRFVPEGSYTRLTLSKQVIMSDTPDEKRDHSRFVRLAKGKVLISGLGLGMVLNACLLKPEVEKVTVLEISADLIELVAPHYRAKFGGKCQILESDALTWKPGAGARLDCVWHDIWPAICSDNLKEMTLLHRKFARRCDWQDSWCRFECKAQKQREKYGRF